MSFYIFIFIVIIGLIYLFFGNSLIDITLDFFIASFSFFKNWIQYDLSKAKMSFKKQFINQIKLDFPIIHLIQKFKK